MPELVEAKIALLDDSEVHNKTYCRDWLENTNAGKIDFQDPGSFVNAQSDLSGNECSLVDVTSVFRNVREYRVPNYGGKNIKEKRSLPVCSQKKSTQSENM